MAEHRRQHVALAETRIVGQPVVGAAEFEEALRREEWLGDASVDIGGFFSRMFAGSLAAHADAAHASTESSTQDMAVWLAERIGRDGALHENEKELLAFLKKETPDIHPALRPLLAKIA